MHLQNLTASQQGLPVGNYKPGRNSRSVLTLGPTRVSKRICVLLLFSLAWEEIVKHTVSLYCPL